MSWGQTAANRSWRRFFASRFIFKGQLSILLRFLEFVKSRRLSDAGRFSIHGGGAVCFGQRGHMQRNLVSKET